ncbi:hypothetical protein TPAU25S_01732 [Tsukamurella paurometabola]|uniref:DUF4873 domain-containing protein n=1 Tax=Tsukamurella paurometabola (strain ATCC 8368 / DSM 20162 / CCUG 35730 / CIP 100753 / JCM 10117 / KCTC 9821 / NBRC 16120 / NCIMB 702349 / NCTC 13040) TaxID=521096 RepID=D5UPE5_TSUPD|nr:DUF4873 domain-containing protein [Tsukamurella paurometabola]ADG78701.1 hypothetical protein Tpau_2089 [Tsukamurella paurometabola DSM 20162]SUP32801.1 Uncharacterised protein [Tsukamurella paurometabola]
MSGPRTAILAASAVPGVDGTVIAPAEVTSARFHQDRDAWSLTTASGSSDYDVIVLADAGLRIDVPTLDPRVAPPLSVGPDNADRAYLGMLIDGVPNLVLLAGAPQRKAQIATLQTWLRWAYAEQATRLMSRPPVTARWIGKGRRNPAKPDRDAVDLSNEHIRDEGVYAGEAVLRSGDYEATSPVRLAGHLEPLDGNYHWYGTVDDLEIGAALKKMPRGSVTVAVGDGDGSPALVTDKTVWGTYRLVGVGAPPFPL